MNTNYGCDVSNRYTGYLDSSDHCNGNLAAGKNKRKMKKKRKPKNSAQKAITVVDASTNTSQIIEPNAIECIDSSVAVAAPEQQPLHKQFSQVKTDGRRDTDENGEHSQNDTNVTDGPASLTSCSSTTQSDMSKESKESDEQSNSTTDGSTTLNVPNDERKWSVICCEEEIAAASAAKLAKDEKKDQAQPELEFKDQRIYPTVYFYNSNFGFMRHRRIVYDFHEGGGARGGRRQNIQSHFEDKTEPEGHMQNRKGRKRRDQNGRRRQNNYARGNTSGVESGDDVEKCSTTSHNEPINRTSYPPPTSSSTQKYDNNATREFLKNRYNKFKNGASDRYRRTELVRNV